MIRFVGRPEQREPVQYRSRQLETHLAANLLPLVTRTFSYSLWMGLAD